MPDALMLLMHTMARAIVCDTQSADALFRLAEKADTTARVGEAAAIRSIARMHRAKIIEYQARLDALGIDCAALAGDASRE